MSKSTVIIILTFVLIVIPPTPPPATPPCPRAASPTLWEEIPKPRTPSPLRPVAATYQSPTRVGLSMVGRKLDFDELEAQLGDISEPQVTPPRIDVPQYEWQTPPSPM